MPREEEEEEIDLTSVPIDLPQVARERFAQHLAEKLVSYFGWALLSLVGVGVGLLVLGIVIGGKDLISLKTIIEHYLSILQAVGTFVASIFGSILGFILGHYFRKEGKG